MRLQSEQRSAAPAAGRRAAGTAGGQLVRRNVGSLGPLGVVGPEYTALFQRLIMLRFCVNYLLVESDMQACFNKLRQLLYQIGCDDD